MRLTLQDKFIQQLARSAGVSLRNNFGKVTKGKTKSARNDIVTVADYEAEDIIISKIRQKYPYHSILSEEAGFLKGTSEYTWIIDPLDGTGNFARQVPLFSVIIALAKGNNIITSVMFDPIHDEIFFAKKGKGAWLNNRRIHVSSESHLQDMTVTISNVRLRSSTERFAHWRSLLALHTTYYKAFGSAAQAICALACGRTDVYIVSGAYPWDIAAGSLLVKEAGGVVKTFQKSRYSWRELNQRVVMTNPKLEKKIMNLLFNYESGRVGTE